MFDTRDEDCCLAVDDIGNIAPVVVHAESDNSHAKTWHGFDLMLVNSHVHFRG